LESKIISVLGSTGYVGTQTLEIAKKLNFKVVALSAGKNLSLLMEQIEKFSPKYVCVDDIRDANSIYFKHKNIEIFNGIDGLKKIAQISEPSLVVNAISGFVGLYASFFAINSCKSIALANKESIVAGSKFLVNLASTNKVKILPIDSEHSAIFQCLNGKTNFKKIILTASGGPFFGKKKEELKYVTVNQTLNHPNWKMGKKISVDSATMINKGLELIEAVNLFDVLPSKIDVLIHPQSIVHSMVEFIDGSIISQLSVPDMKIPIQYALTYPKRFPVGNSLNLSNIKNLSFYKPDEDINLILNLCKKIALDTSTSCAFNAANEVAVSAFMNNKISFTMITEIVLDTIQKFKSFSVKSIDGIIESDRIARQIALKLIELV